MNEPKKRGRPTNAEREAKAALLQAPVVSGDASRELEAVIDAEATEMAAAVQSRPPAAKALSIALMVDAIKDDLDSVRHKAQAYAERVWAGQSPSVIRSERIARIERALEGQGLPTAGIKYPGSEDDEEWSEDDEKPVTWRKAGA